MSERPFMQLYVSDFVGDTLLLSTEHIGAYLLLLIALWNADGELPADEKKLARVARVSVKKWRHLAVDLLPFFEVHDDVLTHHRLTKELQKSERQSESRAAAGARGGAATALKNHKRRPAIAAASAAAQPQHLPEPYRKSASADPNPTEKTERVDKRLEPEAFAECLRLMGEKDKSFIEAKSFPLSIVRLARVAVAGDPVGHEDAA